MNDYQLLDSGNGQKLEKFGPYVVQRPASQAIWQPGLQESKWKEADAIFSREGKNQWFLRSSMPNSWEISLFDVILKLELTDFGHLGIFPEHSYHFDEMRKMCRKFKEKEERAPEILNLFAYSGGATLALAKEGASVCHLDASKTIIEWAKENAALNNLTHGKIRWIVDDVMKFIGREVKRGRRYDAILLDPPSFGRGTKGEVFKIEDEINDILDCLKQLLSDTPLFIFLTCHTPGFTPTVLHNIMSQKFEGKIQSGEMILPSKTFSLPSGTYAKWTPNETYEFAKSKS